MSFKICIKTDKSLPQLATEIRNLFALPPFKHSFFSGELYYQFEVLGMLILIHNADEEDRDPEVIDYLYRFGLQMSFADHELDTDAVEYRLQPYFAQLLTFRLGLDTAFHEKQKLDRHWQLRYRFCSKNPRWNPDILFGEPGWEPAVLETSPGPWRSMHPVL
ncbi:MAG: hypothetical protein NVS3B14_02950 [Ktedonobacteraceae bacterium]